MNRFLLLTIASLIPLCAAEKAADHHAISYCGRIDFSNPKKPVFDWPGTVIETRFTGTSLGIRFFGGETRYNLIIDGGEPSVLCADKGDALYPAVSGLQPGVHRVRLEKRHETTWYSSGFAGFTVDDTTELLPPETKYSRKIEFIGDSYSVGYGVEAPSRDGDDDAYLTYTNISKDFTALTAHHFNAQFQVAAVSGKGLVQNRLNDEPGMTVPYLYDYVLLSGIHTNTPLKKYDITLFTPDLTVINLGTNDFASEAGKPGADPMQFVKGYRDFLAKLRLSRPGTKFVLCASYMYPDNKLLPAVKTVIEQESAAGHSDLIFYDFTGSPSGWSGLHWHPDVKEQQGIADGLIALIEKEKLLEGEPSPVSARGKLIQPVPIRVNGSRIQIISEQNEESVQILCRTLQGREISRLFDGSLSAGTHEFTVGNLAAGTYLITVTAGGVNRASVKVSLK